MTTTFESIRAKTAELQKQIAALQSEAAEQIKPLLQQFITDNPQVEAVRWHQYTPYFNDGDECVFHMGDVYFKFVGAPEDDGDYEDGFIYGVMYDFQEGRLGDTCSLATARACEALAKELSGLEDALKTLFGDHVEVTVTKDGVSVESYDHD